MKLDILLGVFLIAISLSAQATTECNKKISKYFIGTSELNQSVAHLWVNFEGGGSASVSSESAAFDGILSTVMMSIATDRAVLIRYLADNANCDQHNRDWVGIWLNK